MKRRCLVTLTLFSVLSLLTLILFQLYAELTLEQAERLLNNKIAVLNGYNIVLDGAIDTMDDEEDNWDANEEDIVENRIDYASADLWGLGGAVLKQVMDMKDRAGIAVSLGAAIKAVEKAKADAETAETERDRVWTDYVRLANEARISPSERFSKGPDALSVSYPDVSVNCPDCPESWSGSGIGGISGHITSCSVSGHENSQGELVSDPVPHFTCQMCPLSHQHHTFACEGGCGELFRSPTYLSPPPASQGTGNMVAIYYDHRRDPCGKKTGTLTTCRSKAFTCQTPECSNDANHLIDGECGVHKVKKGDASAVSAHSKLPTNHSQHGRCPVTHVFNDETYQCVLINTYYCDLHVYHDFVDGIGTYPVIEPEETTTTTNNNNSGTVSYACGNHSGDSSDSSSHALQASCSSTDSNGNTCTVTNFYACDSHTHSYPAAPPPTPALVECAHGNCSEMVSSRTSHRTACGSGSHYYWPGCPNNTNNWSQDSTHELRTCRRSGCGQTWRRCTSSRNPLCSVRSGGKRCWAQ